MMWLRASHARFPSPLWGGASVWGNHGGSGVAPSLTRERGGSTLGASGEHAP